MMRDRYFCFSDFLFVKKYWQLKNLDVKLSTGSSEPCTKWVQWVTKYHFPILLITRPYTIHLTWNISHNTPVEISDNIMNQPLITFCTCQLLLDHIQWSLDISQWDGWYDPSPTVIYIIWESLLLINEFLSNYGKCFLS